MRVWSAHPGSRDVVDQSAAARAPDGSRMRLGSFDVKILKEVIRIRKQDQEERQEHESLLEVYLHALEDAKPVKKAA